MNQKVAVYFLSQAQASASSLYIPAQSMYQELERYNTNAIKTD